VFLGDALLTEASFGPAAPAQRAIAAVPMPELLAARGAPLTFAVAGQGRLHYEATLRFARKELPAEPVEAGFFVQKTLRAAAAPPGAPGAAPAEGPSFKAGEVVLIEIDVVTPSPRRGVVLEDPLPGGLEALDRRLRGGGGGDWLAGLERTPATRREIRDDRVIYFIDQLPAGITRFRYLARATTIGSFVAPPTRAEEMYAPETFGRTAGGRVRVTAP
jgi:hypothetical protein